ncbi:PD-(D/E)XK motif protein [Akkermansiaceae bacterium]|nr:PD-(D/E)XK motif protein [Akkermansiaceae bacterium]
MNNPWSQIAKPVRDFNVRLVGNKHPLKLYWGRDTRGRYLFIYDALPDGLPEKSSLPNLEGIGAHLTNEGSESAKLILILNETVNWELFHALCSDLVRATEKVEDGQTASSVLLRRLNRWQEFLKKARSGILSMESIKGLIGELIYLSKHVVPVFGLNNAVSFWKGPEGAPQDFAVNNTAIEIKCQSGSSKPYVRITSAEQLDPQLPEGFLTVFTIATADEEDKEQFTLNSVVEELRIALQTASEPARERFEDLLYLAGYITSEAYDEHQFHVIAVKSFTLEDDFPRLKTSEIPPGIDNVTYNLSLEACAEYEGQPNWKHSQ